MEIYSGLLASLIAIFAWPNVLLLVIGAVAGLIVGILPGLGAVVAVALMLPFTYSLGPESAFILILSMYAVSMVAGDITSILFGVPGEPTAAAMVVDGFPLTRRGMAGRALGAAFSGSLVGTLIGAVVFFAMVPVFAAVARMFAAPEFLLLTAAGLLLVGAVSGSEPRKGLLLACMGVLLGTIGRDPQLGVARYTFDLPLLTDGLAIVPVVIGLYAMPEIVQLAGFGGSIANTPLSKTSGMIAGFRETFRHWRIVLGTSIAGTGIGMVPGLGGIVAQWLAYGFTAKYAKRPAEFGKGDIRGVIGPAAASNSKESGNLLTVLAFGIPPTATMALLLGAFLIQGLVPGEEMLTTEIDLTFTMIWTLIVGGILGIVICAPLIRPLAAVSRIPGRRIVPFLIVLVLLGAYADRGQATDMLVFIIFGLIGILMERYDWPRAAFVLGFILGPVLERNLGIAVQAYGWSMFERPLVIVFTIIIGVIVVSGLVRKKRGSVVADVMKESAEVAGGRS